MIPDTNDPVAVIEDGRKYQFYLQTHYYQGKRQNNHVLFKHRADDGEISNLITIRWIMFSEYDYFSPDGKPYMYIEQ